MAALIRKAIPPAPSNPVFHRKPVASRRCFDFDAANRKRPAAAVPELHLSDSCIATLDGADLNHRQVRVSDRAVGYVQRQRDVAVVRGERRAANLHAPLLVTRAHAGRHRRPDQVLVNKPERP